MDLELNGKRALVTGGSRGIGFATACRLAQEGAEVAIVARRAGVLDVAVSEMSGRTPGAFPLFPVKADVSTAKGAQDAVSRAIDRLGGLDILVNNAGRSAGGSALEQSDRDWQRDLDLKLYGALRMTRLAVAELRKSGSGRVVNVTAIAGKHPGSGSAPSSVSRAAGIALTKVLSKELAPDGILVNTVCIGLIQSEQIERGAQVRFPDSELSDALTKMGSGVPLGRIGRAEEAGDVIAFLCSQRASYVTGVAINIDGGASANV